MISAKSIAVGARFEESQLRASMGAQYAMLHPSCAQLAHARSVPTSGHLLYIATKKEAASCMTGWLAHKQFKRTRGAPSTGQDRAPDTNSFVDIWE